MRNWSKLSTLALLFVASLPFAGAAPLVSSQEFSEWWSSNAKVEDESVALGKSLQALASGRHAKKLVVVAHSKGAAETLAYAISHSTFVRRHVKAIFLVQGAMGGSRIADYLRGGATEPDSRVDDHTVNLFKMMSRIGKFLDPILDQGLTTLTTSHMHQLFDDLLHKNVSGAKSISDRIFYVTSHRRAKENSGLLLVMGTYLSAYYGDSDGLILEPDQVLTGIGTPLISVNADHASLLVASPISNVSNEIRDVLTDSIVKSVIK